MSRFAAAIVAIDAAALSWAIGSASAVDAPDVRLARIVVLPFATRSSQPLDKRLVGMGMGAGVLSAHVQVYRVARLGSIWSASSTRRVHGANKLPPLGPVGLAVHGIRRGLTLAADVDKLAKLISRRISSGQVGS